MEEWRVILLEVSTYDHRNRAICKGQKSPRWEQIQTAIQGLDGQWRSDMVVEAANGSLLVIGGGEGTFHVQITRLPGSEPRNLLLCDPLRGIETEEIIIGGVSTPLPARLIVDEEKTLKAAYQFFQDGAADPQLTWQPD